MKVTKNKNRKIEYIVVHHTGCVCLATNSLLWLKNPTNTTEASADYFVDGGVVQYNNDIPNQYTWHCGDGAMKPGQKIFNRNSIGIEMCNSVGSPSWTVPDTTIEATIKLIRQLQKKYRIPNENIVFHYDVSGKNCPFPDTRKRFMKLFNNSNLNTV